MKEENIICKEGFDYCFDQDACKECEGNCCIGESGYIWVNSEEIKNIAKFLKIDENILIDKFLIKIGYKYSLKERHYKNGYACIFFENGCKIYPVRPTQCRTFPFWDYFKENIEELKKECPGVITKNEK